MRKFSLIESWMLPFSSFYLATHFTKMYTDVYPCIWVYTISTTSLEWVSAIFVESQMRYKIKDKMD